MINYIVPNWFFGIDSTIEAIFSLIILIISLASFKIYSITKEPSIKRFGTGFLLLALSYILWAGINAITVPGLTEQISSVSANQLSVLGLLISYSYMLLFISGLVLLAYNTFNSQKTEIFYLILCPSLMVVLTSIEKVITTRILAIFFLSFIAYHYMTEYYRKGNRKTLLVFIGFLLLMLSNIGFIFSPSSSLAYVIGHLIEAGAYSLFLATLLRTLQINKP